MARELTAILLETRSIQKYVFGCNQLKTNTGASFLVDNIFTGVMQEVLQNNGLKMPVRDWRDIEGVEIAANEELEAEIAFIGGGNMLILLRKDEEYCKNIVRQWSREVLLRAPGLKTGAVIDKLDLDDFNNKFSAMRNKLKEYQNNIQPQVDFPYTGLTLECPYTGKAADFYDSAAQDGLFWHSSEYEAKEMALKNAKDVMQDYCRRVLSNLEFSNDINEIGYIKGEKSYICVIHIDGNNMGKKFSDCADLPLRKQKSIKVSGIIKKGFAKLVDRIVDEYKAGVYDKYLDEALSKLPIRPIILGGDDITFVCPGRVGLQYAAHLMDFLSEDASDRFTCCAGVAIVPAKYPFFRAYQLAEQLCDEAKKRSRVQDDNYLDFAVLHGEIFGSLEQLREKQYQLGKYKLHYGPYRLTSSDVDKHSLESLFALHKQLYSRLGKSQNKLKKLRSALLSGLHKQEILLKNSEELQQLLRDSNNKAAAAAHDFWEAAGDDWFVTRYMDAIEIDDFVYEEQETLQNEKDENRD